jgi:alpha-beta hydrolase superfamily lysophospholipase
VSEGFIETPDGVRLAVRRHGEGGARGVVVLFPAMMCDARTLDRPRGDGLASRWAARGWEVWTVDFRGHGRSGRAETPVRYDHLVARDVPAVAAAARRVAGMRPLVLGGHSLGGHVTLAALAWGCADADAWIGLAANIWLPDLEPDWRLWARKVANLTAFVAVSRAVGRFPARWLKMGTEDESTAYVEDLARFPFQRRWGPAAFHDVDYLTLARAWRRPKLNLLASDDRLLASFEGAMRWTCAAGATPMRVGRGASNVDGAPEHISLVTNPAHLGWLHTVDRWLSWHVETPSGVSREGACV